MTERPLALHAAALLLMLAAAATSAGTGVSSDEGAGVYQAVLLNRGGWTLAPTLPELDPLGQRQPFLRADSGVLGRAPYGKHPLYPVVLSIGRWVAPVGGLVGVSVLGVWIAAVFAALVAERIRSGRGPVALWLVGALSPLTVDGIWVLAHAPAAGTAAVTIFAAERVLRRGPLSAVRLAGWLGLGALASGVTVALRTEGAILVAALAVGLLVCRRPDRRSFMAAAAVLGGGGAARVMEVAVLRRIVGAAVAVPGTPSSAVGFLPARWDAFQASWLDPGTGEGRLLLAAATLLAVAAVAHRGRFPVALVAAFGALAGVAAVVWVASDLRLVPGLVSATAWLGAGVIVLGRRSLATGLPRLLAVTTVLAALGILATQYSYGGGVEWGGRFYAILIPGAGALIAGAWPHERRVESLALVVALAVVAAITSVGGVLYVRQEHGRTDGLERDILAAAAVAAPGRPGDPDARPVVLSNHRLWPQLVWRSFDGLRWVTVEQPDTACALVDLRRAGFQRIVVTEKPLAPLVRQAADLGWQEDAASPGTGFARALVAVGDPPNAASACVPP